MKNRSSIDGLFCRRWDLGVLPWRKRHVFPDAANVWWWVGLVFGSCFGVNQLSVCFFARTKSWVSCRCRRQCRGWRKPNSGSRPRGFRRRAFEPIFVRGVTTPLRLHSYVAQGFPHWQGGQKLASVFCSHPEIRFDRIESILWKSTETSRVLLDSNWWLAGCTCTRKEIEKKRAANSVTRSWRPAEYCMESTQKNEAEKEAADAQGISRMDGQILWNILMEMTSTGV